MECRNGTVEKVWDIEVLFEAVLAGMKKCRELGKIPVSVGIDTWAVADLSSWTRTISGSEMPLPIAMTARKEWMRRSIARCRRKNSMHRPVFRNKFSTAFISSWRGRRKSRNSWKKQRLSLMIPDYLNFLLSGVKAQEYTNATTTQLVNPETGDWNREMIQKLGYPRKIFLPIRSRGL